MPTEYELTELGDKMYTICVGRPMKAAELAERLGCAEATVRRIAREHPELFDADSMITGTY